MSLVFFGFKEVLENQEEFWIGFLLEKTAAAIRMEVIVPLRTRPFLPPDFEEIERTVSTQDQYINIFERHQNGPDVRRGSINLSITQDRNSKFYSNE